MIPDSKFVFFGTPEFSSAILKKLIGAGFVPDAVVCNPDRPVGRKKIITSPPVKILAQNQGIKVIQPENISIESIKLEVGDVDLFIVAAYAKIIPKEILDLPRLGTIGVHPSLLPKYRGSSPIQSVLLDGEKETGITLYLLDEKMDHGQIIAQGKNVISENDNYESLLLKLADLGGKLLADTLPAFLKGGIKPITQDESLATYTKKFRTEDGFIDNLEIEDAENGENADKANIFWRKIKALNPEPGVWTIRNGKRIKILEAETKDGKLAIKIIQEEGGKPRTYKKN